MLSFFDVSRWNIGYAMNVDPPQQHELECMRKRIKLLDIFLYAPVRSVSYFQSARIPNEFASLQNTITYISRIVRLRLFISLIQSCYVAFYSALTQITDKTWYYEPCP